MAIWLRRASEMVQDLEGAGSSDIAVGQHHTVLVADHGLELPDPDRSEGCRAELPAFTFAALTCSPSVPSRDLTVQSCDKFG
ncbi:MAG: hypothetical protein AB7O56_03475 [Bauldia sp.]